MRQNVDSHRDDLIAPIEQIVIKAHDMIIARVSAVHALEREAEIIPRGGRVEGPLKGQQDLIERHRIGVIGVELAEVLAIDRIGRIGEHAGLNLDSARDRIGPSRWALRGNDGRRSQVSRGSSPSDQYSHRYDPNLHHNSDYPLSDLVGAAIVLR
jgi:hypothetical protein